MRSNARGAWRRSLVVASVALVAGVAAACGAGSTAQGNNAAPTGGEVDESADLRIAYPVTTSLDPADAPEPAQLTIATWPVYDRLLQVSVESGYEPMLATDWKFSSGGRSLTLTLREGVTFSDGTPFDAQAVKANLEHSMAAPEDTMLQANVANIAKVEVLSPTEVEIGLREPNTSILQTLSSTLGGIMISPKALDSPDLATNPVGTGAYVIDSFQPGQAVTYSRRDDEGGIWDDKTGKPATVTVKTMGADQDAMTNALKGGQLDMVVWSSEVSRFQSEISAGSLYHTVMPGVLNMTGLNFNTKVKPFDDPLVRKAMNHAIDRQAIVEAFMPDSEARVQPWPDGLPGYAEEREDAYSYDPEKAKDLLAQAGHPDGLDAGEMLVAAVGQFGAASEVIQSNLADVGIEVDLRNVQVYTLVTEWAKGGAGVELMYMSLPSIDPAAWLDRLFLNPAWRPGGPDQMIAKVAERVSDPNMSEDERAAALGEAVDHATEEALYVPLWQGVGGFVASDKVRGLDDIASVNGGVADLRNTYLVK